VISVGTRHSRQFGIDIVKRQKLVGDVTNFLVVDQAVVINKKLISFTLQFGISNPLYFNNGEIIHRIVFLIEKRNE